MTLVIILTILSYRVWCRWEIFVLAGHLPLILLLTRNHLLFFNWLILLDLVMSFSLQVMQVKSYHISAMSYWLYPCTMRILHNLKNMFTTEYWYNNLLPYFIYNWKFGRMHNWYRLTKFSLFQILNFENFHVGILNPCSHFHLIFLVNVSKLIGGFCFTVEGTWCPSTENF